MKCRGATAAIAAVACMALQGVAPVVAVRIDDIPPSLASLLPSPLEPYLQQVNRETAERVQNGELEHLVYYILQSDSFTSNPPIEPAVSAREFHTSGRIPATVERRIALFETALGRRSGDERMTYFRKLVPVGQQRAGSIRDAYIRAMRFLYSKEVELKTGVYEQRAHSSDTQLASSYTVAVALEVLKQLDPKVRIRRALIIGPGADFAPRTGLSGSRPPRSYQPFAVTGDLMRLGLAKPRDLIVDCIDVNDRVLDAVRLGPPRTWPNEAGDRDFVAWQQRLPREVHAEVRVEPLNIVTGRLSDRRYDLIIATNVLLYFPAPQLLLALANIKAMMAPGSVFIHNDTRLETERYTKEMGLNWVQARRILVAQGRQAPLYDVFAIVRK